MAAYATLLSLFFLFRFASIASASSSASPANLLFRILDSTRGDGDDGWDAADIIRSFSPASLGSAAKEADFISSLPGQPKDSPSIKQYGGYVNIGDGDNLFYYFAEANASRPLLLWITGGPGCSSVGSGAFLQHGPFSVNSDGKTLLSNPNAWVNAINTIYVDAPSNLGFSYSTNKNASVLYDDKKVALSCLKFILGWLKKFPEYGNTTVYLGGGGYAGNVIPRLADLISEYNRRPESGSSPINLGKIILGNPTVDIETEIWGVIDFQWISGMISGKTRDEVSSKCRETTIRSEACRVEFRKLPVNDLGSGPVYPYGLTTPVCSPNLKPGFKIEQYYECDEKNVADYLSQEEVQRALHASSPLVSNRWIQCNEEVTSKYKFSKSSLAIIKRLASEGNQFIIYSGDSDAVVPTVGTRYAMNSLNLSDNSDFNPWFHDKATIGGFMEVYNGTISFAVVRGAGHVTTKQYPERTLSLIKSVV
ncbi:serine carboxypeptidase-like 40 [Wolffia australiana]